MVVKTTSFKKKGKGKKWNFKKNGKQVATQVKKPKSGPKPETECFYCKGIGHSKQNLLGDVVISKKFLRTRKIMVMHSNERGECCPYTLVVRKRKRYDNAVDVFVC